MARTAPIFFLFIALSVPLFGQADYETVQPHQGRPGVETSGLFSAASSNPQKITKTLQGITFDSDYDNGSLFDIRSIDIDQFEADLYVDSGELGTRSYWFRFRIDGAAGRSILINLDYSKNPRPVIRFGSEPWRRMTQDEAPDLSTLHLNFPSIVGSAEVAFYYPLGYSETFQSVATIIRDHDAATSSLIGNSHQGRGLWMIEVTNSASSDLVKHRVWVHARAHAGESTSQHVFAGFLKQITEESPIGERLRRYCIFDVVPMLNCDGVFLGHTRWDSQGIDPEREWDTPGRTPEVASIYAKVNQFMASDNPIEVALNLHSTTGAFRDSFFFKHLRPSVTAEFEALQQSYIEAFRNATPLFDNLSPQTSQLDPVQFVESYYWNQWRESVMAMTYEGHFHKRITDNDWISDQDYEELGRSLAVALIEYFDLPPLPTSTRWGWYLY